MLTIKQALDQLLFSKLDGKAIKASIDFNESTFDIFNEALDATIEEFKTVRNYTNIYDTQSENVRRALNNLSTRFSVFSEVVAKFAANDTAKIYVDAFDLLTSIDDMLSDSLEWDQLALLSTKQIEYYNDNNLNMDIEYKDIGYVVIDSVYYLITIVPCDFHFASSVTINKYYNC